MWIVRFLPVWLVLCGVLTIVLSNLPGTAAYLSGLSGGSDERRLTGAENIAPASLAPLFTAEVDHWEQDILRWATNAGLDPNLVATIMQIESCGDPDAVSSAGASGLLQVMPLHFTPDENPMDPETNAQRGLSILAECLYSPYNPENDVGMAFACYNAGPRIFLWAWDVWPQESRYYYTWGTGIYTDAQNNLTSSETLDRWLTAGGANLCASARIDLGLTDG